MDGRRSPTEANQQVALEINTSWLESVQHRAGMSLHGKPPAEPTIFRVPPSMRRNNQLDYEPKLVSIGPYHRGKTEDLKAMEELKWRLLHDYLSKVPNWSNNERLRNMKDLEMRARNCYSEVIDLNSDQFVEMLLLDGCFIVQIFFIDNEELTKLLGNYWWFGHILRDLLLLENQLPYFIIEHLLDTLRMPGRDSFRLQQLAISYFKLYLPQYSSVPELPGDVFKVDNLLHLLHQWILSISNLPRRSNSSHSEEIPLTIPTITELTEAGVKIKLSEATCFLHISFRKGELEIPAIVVDDSTNFVFANLIALEQCRPTVGSHVSDYARFMDGIINTPRDVELLYREKIVHPCLGDNEDIASLFNKLCKGVFYDTNKTYLKGAYINLNAYCQSSWPRHRAKFMHDYFSNPWAMISLGAAILLLGLTILQSVYSVLGSYKT